MDESDFRADGETYGPEHDRERLKVQFERVRRLMADGKYRSLAEISALTATPAPSASARLRDLRKERFGGFIVDRRARFDRRHGIFEYRVRRPGQEPPR